MAANSNQYTEAKAEMVPKLLNFINIKLAIILAW